MGPKNYDENSFLVPIHLKITRVFVVGKNSDVVTTTTQTWAAVAHIFSDETSIPTSFTTRGSTVSPLAPLRPASASRASARPLPTTSTTLQARTA